MRNDDFIDGGLPEGGGFQVDLFLAVESMPFDIIFVVFVRVINIGEAGDTVDNGSAAKIVGCFVSLVVADGFLGFLFEVRGDWKESVGIFICGCVINVFLVLLEMLIGDIVSPLLTPIKC